MAEHRFTSLSEEALHRKGIAEIFMDYVHIFRDDVGPDFLFEDDNVQPHGSVEVPDILQTWGPRIIDTAVATPLSPDINPTEHISDAIGRRVAQRTISPRTVQELKTTLREELDDIPPRTLL
ncbi:hypothetical protein TNCV_94401 [Trichonephila clavipes]|nr:hypothetical protein TNCV_94401 [Trichonephila clavipes]